MRVLVAMLMAAIVAAAVPAQACGYCDGDRLASVYDGKVVADAKRDGLGVVYVGIEGSFGGAAQERAAVVKAIESVPGIKKGSVFVSYAPSAARLIFRPSKGDAASLVRKASVVLKKQTGCTLVILRVDCDTVAT